MSKVIHVFLKFCVTPLCDWPRTLAPLSKPIGFKSKSNSRFPALQADCFEFLVAPSNIFLTLSGCFDKHDFGIWIL